MYANHPWEKISQMKKNRPDYQRHDLTHWVVSEKQRLAKKKGSMDRRILYASPSQAGWQLYSCRATHGQVEMVFTRIGKGKR